MFILFSLFSISLSSLYISVFIFFSCLMLVGYLYSISKYFIHSFSSSPLHVL
jgi:hypothetical protein